MNKKKEKIWFIVLVSVFATLWVASMVMLGLSVFSETATVGIETWYTETFTNAEAVAIGEAEEKVLNLFSTSMYFTLFSTAGLLIVLLFKELKKKYNIR